jgi:predicted negative regulator of RcsB-dependent stress response
MGKICGGVLAGVLLAVGAPIGWRYLAARNNTQIHSVTPR